MFDLTLVKTALLANAPTLEQVILPEGIGSLAVDSAEVLIGLVESEMGNRVYPLLLPNDPVYPASVYQLVSSDIVEVDGYPILRDDGYLLSISEQEYGDMRDVVEAVRVALLGYATAGEAGTVRNEDQADKYNEKIALFETALALRMTHLALASQAVPAAFVYTYSHDVVPSNRYGDVEVEESTRVGVLLVARIPTNGVSALEGVLEEIREAVMDVTDTGWKKALWYGGEQVASHNSLVLWRENFAFPRNREFS